MVIQRRVPARCRLQPVVEIEHDFVERQLVYQQNAPTAEILELLLVAALFFEQLQNLADILFARNDGRVDDRLFDLLGLRRVRELVRTLDHDHFIVRQRHAVTHARRRGDQVDIELALEPLLNDLHVEETQEAAAEAEAKGRPSSPVRS